MRAGAASKVITVYVNPDSTRENSEFFSVMLFDGTGATIGNGVLIGTIINDDGGKPSIPIPPPPDVNDHMPHAMLWPDDEPRLTPFKQQPGIHYCGLESDEHRGEMAHCDLIGLNGLSLFSDSEHVAGMQLHIASKAPAFTLMSQSRTDDAVFFLPTKARKAASSVIEDLIRMIGPQSDSASTSIAAPLQHSLTDSFFRI